MRLQPQGSVGARVLPLLCSAVNSLQHGVPKGYNSPTTAGKRCIVTRADAYVHVLGTRSPPHTAAQEFGVDVLEVGVVVPQLLQHRVLLPPRVPQMPRLGPVCWAPRARAGLDVVGVRPVGQQLAHHRHPPVVDGLQEQCWMGWENHKYGGGGADLVPSQFGGGESPWILCGKFQTLPEMLWCVGLCRLGVAEPQGPLTMQGRPICHTLPVMRVNLVSGPDM